MSSSPELDQRLIFDGKFFRFQGQAALEPGLADFTARCSVDGHYPGHAALVRTSTGLSAFAFV
jgi:hypothetical protein